MALKSSASTDCMDSIAASASAPGDSGSPRPGLIGNSPSIKAGQDAWETCSNGSHVSISSTMLSKDGRDAAYYIGALCLDKGRYHPKLGNIKHHAMNHVTTYKKRLQEGKVKVEDEMIDDLQAHVHNFEHSERFNQAHSEETNWPDLRESAEKLQSLGIDPRPEEEGPKA